MSGHSWQKLDRTLMVSLLVSVLWLVLRSYEVGGQQVALASDRFYQIIDYIQIHNDLLTANRNTTVKFIGDVNALCIATEADCPSIQGTQE